MQTPPITPGREPLIILGASARAAAQSAVRGGFAPCAADLFADADLLACCPARQVEDYPAGLALAAREFPPGPWMYTGGLENHAALVERIAAERPLLGNPASVLRAVRDPLQFAAALRDRGLDHLDVCLAPLKGKPCLRKPRNSCGGMRISIWSPGQSHEPSGTWYYQEFMPGESAAAAYVADGRKAKCWGVTRQLVGEAWTGAAPFQYCGSLGPLVLTDERRAVYERIGACLVERFSLRGIFGVDVIENDAGVWPVEVNPRYTASVEILERAFSISAVALHAAACRPHFKPHDGPALAGSLAPPYKRCHGKAVVYAPRDFIVDPALIEFVARANEDDSWPIIADVPRVGTHVRLGQPVVSLFAARDGETDTVRLLRELAAKVTSCSKPPGVENCKPSHLP